MTDSVGKPTHGGVAGWYRVASGFSALAAIEVSIAAWAALTHVTGATPRPSVAVIVSLATSGLLAATGALLAARHDARAGALMLASGVVTFAMGGGVSLLLLIGLLAMVAATARPTRHARPAA